MVVKFCVFKPFIEFLPRMHQSSEPSQHQDSRETLKKKQDPKNYRAMELLSVQNSCLLINELD